MGGTVTPDHLEPLNQRRQHTDRGHIRVFCNFVWNGEQSSSKNCFDQPLGLLVSQNLHFSCINRIKINLTLEKIFILQHGTYL